MFYNTRHSTITLVPCIIGAFPIHNSMYDSFQEPISKSQLKSLTDVTKEPAVKLKIKNVSKKFKDKEKHGKSKKPKRRVSISNEINVMNIC